MHLLYLTPRSIVKRVNLENTFAVELLWVYRIVTTRWIMSHMMTQRDLKVARPAILGSVSPEPPSTLLHVPGMHVIKSKSDDLHLSWTIVVLGFDSRRGLGIFRFTTASRTALGPTQPPTWWVPWAFCLGVKRTRREADHSLPSSAEVKNSWSYTSTPQYVFMAWCSVKHEDNFTFTFTFTYISSDPF
jgi:hypothetical protein